MEQKASPGNQKGESCWKRPHGNHDEECRQSLGAGLGPSSQPARKWALWYDHHEELDLAKKLVNFKADFFPEALEKDAGILEFLYYYLNTTYFSNHITFIPSRFYKSNSLYLQNYPLCYLSPCVFISSSNALLSVRSS